MNQNVPTIVATRVYDPDQMDLEEMFGLMVTSLTLLSVQLPGPYTPAIDSLLISLHVICTRLETQGIVSRSKIDDLSAKMARESIDEMQKEMKESGVEEFIDGVKAEIEKKKAEATKQADTAKQN